MLSVDLNCDMGESFGVWTMGRDPELMDYVSSVNIACGFHAGDASTMRETVELAAFKGLAIGAHPSYPDLQGFGRRNMSLSPQQVFDTVLYQVAALKGICEASGTNLHHVKPHGALYNQAAIDADRAEAIATAVARLDKSLILYGLAGSRLISAAQNAGLRTASEVFADRSYVADANLTPRSQPNALIADAGTAAAQVLQMVKEGTVIATTGETIQISAETICIHGDGPNALDFARSVRETLVKNGVVIQSVQKMSA